MAKRQRKVVCSLTITLQKDAVENEAQNAKEFALFLKSKRLFCMSVELI